MNFLKFYFVCLLAVIIALFTVPISDNGSFASSVINTANKEKNINKTNKNSKNKEAKQTEKKIKNIIKSMIDIFMLFLFL